MTGAFGGTGYSFSSYTACLNFSLTADEAGSYAHELYVKGRKNYGLCDIYLNGTDEGCLIKESRGEKGNEFIGGFAIPLPAGKLSEGLNTIYFVGSSAWLNFDYLKMTVINNGSKNRDPRGTCLTIK
jgi:hypothetical protein